jgi:lysozyme
MPDSSANSGLVAIRSAVGSIVLLASTYAGIAGFEGFRDTAYIPVKGDVPTIGHGTTKGVKMGDTITPERAMHRLREEVDSVYAQGVRRCVKVPLTDYELGAYISLAYNVGVPTFCRKAAPGKPPNLIDLINAKQYKQACRRIEAFVYGPDGRGGKKVLPGLVKRRAEERRICEGKALDDRPQPKAA